MPVHRLQNPFEHWLLGLIAEVATFLAFILVVSALAALVMLVS